MWLLSRQVDCRNRRSRSIGILFTSDNRLRRSRLACAASLAATVGFLQRAHCPSLASGALTGCWSYSKNVHYLRCPRNSDSACPSPARRAPVLAPSPEDAPRRLKSFLEKTLIAHARPHFAAPQPPRRAGALESPVERPPTTPRAAGLLPLDLSGLNAQQRAAIDHVTAPCSSSPAPAPARPASSPAASPPHRPGRRPLEHPRRHLHQTRPPTRCANASSTWSAAPRAAVNVGTFHGQALRILRRDIHHLGREPEFTIYDADDQLAPRQAGHGRRRHRPHHHQPRRHPQTPFPAPRTNSPTPSSTPNASEGYFEEAVAQVYHRYQRLLDSANGVDFGDMIAFCVRLFREFPDLRAFYQDRYRFILVDEYQDTNRAQYEFVRLLAEGRGNVCVVGDDDQSIYTWRGADIRNILDFEAQFADSRVIRLERNYRSTGNILASANAVISKVANRAEKTPLDRARRRPAARNHRGLRRRRRSPPGRQPHPRTSRRGHPEPRHRHHLPHQRPVPTPRGMVRPPGTALPVGRRHRVLWSPRKCATCWPTCGPLPTPRDLVSFERIANTPRRGIGVKTLQVLREWARTDQPLLR